MFPLNVFDVTGGVVIILERESGDNYTGRLSAVIEVLWLYIFAANNNIIFRA